MNKVTTYLSGSIAELRAVKWPTRTELYKLTLLVLGISVGTAVIVGALDFGFQYGLKLLIEMKK